MLDRVRRLRTQARQVFNPEVPTATRYPQELRAAMLALARQRRATGVAVTRIARELGVRPRTLSLWLRRRGPAAGRELAGRPLVRRVALTTETPAERAASSPVLITPHGLRVEGLDRDTLVTVLRALG
jgi:transposase-like protein